MANDPVLQLLGLARKAGKLEVGEEPVGAVCRSRHARLILLAEDAAPNTCRRAAHFGQAGNVLWLRLPYTKEELGLLLGRKSCAMAALTDYGLAAAVADKLVLMDPERYGPAAQALRPKADRALQRQQEKRRHEKKLQRGKKKPWAVPPRGSPPPARPAQSAQGEPNPKRSPKPGLGGRKLTAKPISGGKNAAGKP